MARQHGRHRRDGALRAFEALRQRLLSPRLYQPAWGASAVERVVDDALVDQASARRSRRHVHQSIRGADRS
eukprot:scaffold69816_cov33-Tisochrysis_lutea.AAC.2